MASCVVPMAAQTGCAEVTETETRLLASGSTPGSVTAYRVETVASALTDGLGRQTVAVSAASTKHTTPAMTNNGATT